MRGEGRVDGFALSFLELLGVINAVNLNVQRDMTCTRDHRAALRERDEGRGA
jgi:hypothetical protein